MLSCVEASDHSTTLQPENPLITPLSFDSSLFNYPVGKLFADETWDELEFLENVKDYHLVYIFSNQPLILISDSIRWVDTKLTFQKELLQKSSFDPDITPFSGELNEELKALAFQSGIYSRFKTDPRLVNGEYEKLYSLWIQNAVRQREVLIAKENAGFISCHLSDQKAQIGLIAVTEDLRGKGWGKRLVLAAENFALAHNATQMLIPTQESNSPACALYRHLGYDLKEQVFIYHYHSHQT